MRETVYIGWDQRETEAYAVAENSLTRHASGPVDIKPLKLHQLYEERLLWRPVERVTDRMYDHLSDAPMSTEFAISRFLVPILQRSGWALFVDCDVVFLGDVSELFALAEDRFALMCVKHDHLPEVGVKMDGQLQVPYVRKNWSSVMLLNCDHPAWHRLTLQMVNHYPGDLLHRFCWLRDKEIGALPLAWNWLVGLEPKPEVPKLAHFTMGGPWLKDWQGAPHDELWLEAQAHHAPACGAGDSGGSQGSP